MARLVQLRNPDGSFGEDAGGGILRRPGLTALAVLAVSWHNPWQMRGHAASFAFLSRIDWSRAIASGRATGLDAALTALALSQAARQKLAPRYRPSIPPAEPALAALRGLEHPGGGFRARPGGQIHPAVTLWGVVALRSAGVARRDPAIVRAVARARSPRFAAHPYFGVVSAQLEGEVARLVRELGAPTWKERRLATRGLVALGSVATAALARHARHPDPEVRFRVAKVLRILPHDRRPRPELLASLIAGTRPAAGPDTARATPISLLLSAKGTPHKHLVDAMVGADWAPASASARKLPAVKPVVGWFWRSRGMNLPMPAFPSMPLVGSLRNREVYRYATHTLRMVCATRKPRAFREIGLIG